MNNWKNHSLIFYKLLIILSFLIFYLQCSISLAQDKKVVIVIKSIENKQSSFALRGFKESLIKNNISFILKEYKAGDGKNIFNKINPQNTDLLLTIGTPATKLCIDHVKNIPVIFSMVLHPPKSMLKADNLTGVSLNIPVKTQFEYLNKILPKSKKIGVLYNPEENGRIIKKAVQIAGQLGYILTIFPIKSPKDILKISDLKIDVLWLIPDMTVCQPTIIKHILLNALKQKIPVIGISPSYVKAGALFALSCDYEDIGHQSGELAIKILNGKTSKHTHINVPRKTKLYLNIAVMKRLGLIISDQILNSAEEVFGK
jgi:putative ABC transport system substrate-binding protein